MTWFGHENVTFENVKQIMYKIVRSVAPLELFHWFFYRCTTYLDPRLLWHLLRECVKFSLPKATDLRLQPSQTRVFMVLSGRASCDVVCNEAAVPLTQTVCYV